MVESTEQIQTSPENKEVILLTGITGFVGAWVGKLLLEQLSDRFKIRASVRSLANKQKLEPLRQEFGEQAYNKIEFVEADLMQKDQLNKAIQGASYIIHVASPLPGATQLTEDQMITPATEGMKTILESCLVHKVKRLIVTSSLATIVGGVWKRDTGNFHYTEDDVAPPEGADGYGRSKIAQERVIREFIKERQIGNLEIVTLHPTMVIGPTLTSERVSTPEGISKFMNRSIPGVPEMCVPSVDVRDVAEAHVRALFAKDLHGKRILLNKASMTMIDLANYLDEEFRQYGYNVQTRRIGYCPLKLASYFDTQVKTILPMIGVNLTADNKLSTQLLGIDYSKWTLKESTVALGYSLIEKGLVPDKRPSAIKK